MTDNQPEKTLVSFFAKLVLVGREPSFIDNIRWQSAHVCAAVKKSAGCRRRRGGGGCNIPSVYAFFVVCSTSADSAMTVTNSAFVLESAPVQIVWYKTVWLQLLNWSCHYNVNICSCIYTDKWSCHLNVTICSCIYAHKWSVSLQRDHF